MRWGKVDPRRRRRQQSKLFKLGNMKRFWGDFWFYFITEFEFTTHTTTNFPGTQLNRRFWSIIWCVAGFCMWNADFTSNQHCRRRSFFPFSSSLSILFSPHSNSVTTKGLFSRSKDIFSHINRERRKRGTYSTVRKYEKFSSSDSDLNRIRM